VRTLPPYPGGYGGSVRTAQAAVSSAG
jgi:hypothetical protein